ncbi:MAG: MotA/TolQ/ExbB proton channel family protein [Myxococcota bacterium]
MEINLVEIWQNMGTPVRVVVVVLTLQAVACIAVTIDRLLLLLTSRRKARRFAAEAAPMMEEEDYGGVLELASKGKGGHLGSLLYTGLHAYVESRERGQGREKAADLTRRALERRGESLSTELHKGMNVLASTGSTAPFVGLLGTVLGIINAFKLIASSGSGGIGTIGAAIGEALVVTGYGLMVAIPAVLLFNWLSGRIASYEAGLVNAGSELVDRLEVHVPLQHSTSPGREAAGRPEDSTMEAVSAA